MRREVIESKKHQKNLASPKHITSTHDFFFICQHIKEHFKWKDRQLGKPSKKRMNHQSQINPKDMKDSSQENRYKQPHNYTKSNTDRKKQQKKRRKERKKKHQKVK